MIFKKIVSVSQNEVNIRSNPLKHVLFLIKLIRLLLSHKLVKNESLGSTFKSPIIKKLSYEQAKESIIIVKLFRIDSLYYE